MNRRRRKTTNRSENSQFKPPDGMAEVRKIAFKTIYKVHEPDMQALYEVLDIDSNLQDDKLIIRLTEVQYRKLNQLGIIKPVESQILEFDSSIVQMRYAESEKNVDYELEVENSNSIDIERGHSSTCANEGGAITNIPSLGPRHGSDRIHSKPSKDSYNGKGGKKYSKFKFKIPTNRKQEVGIKSMTQSPEDINIDSGKQYQKNIMSNVKGSFTNGVKCDQNVIMKSLEIKVHKLHEDFICSGESSCGKEIKEIDDKSVTNNNKTEPNNFKDEQNVSSSNVSETYRKKSMRTNCESTSSTIVLVSESSSQRTNERNCVSTPLSVNITSELQTTIDIENMDIEIEGTIENKKKLLTNSENSYVKLRRVSFHDNKKKQTECRENIVIENDCSTVTSIQKSVSSVNGINSHAETKMNEKFEPLIDFSHCVNCYVKLFQLNYEDYLTNMNKYLGCPMEFSEAGKKKSMYIIEKEEDLPKKLHIKHGEKSLSELKQVSARARESSTLKKKIRFVHKKIETAQLSLDSSCEKQKKSSCKKKEASGTTIEVKPVIYNKSKLVPSNKISIQDQPSEELPKNNDFLRKSGHQIEEIICSKQQLTSKKKSSTHSETGIPPKDVHFVSDTKIKVGKIVSDKEKLASKNKNSKQNRSSETLKKSSSIVCDEKIEIKQAFSDQSKSCTSKRTSLHNEEVGEKNVFNIVKESTNQEETFFGNFKKKSPSHNHHHEINKKNKKTVKNTSEAEESISNKQKIVDCTANKNAVSNAKPQSEKNFSEQHLKSGKNSKTDSKNQENKHVSENTKSDSKRKTSNDHSSKANKKYKSSSNSKDREGKILADIDKSNSDRETADHTNTSPVCHVNYKKEKVSVDREKSVSDVKSFQTPTKDKKVVGDTIKKTSSVDHSSEAGYKNSSTVSEKRKQLDKVSPDKQKSSFVKKSSSHMQSSEMHSKKNQGQNKANNSNSSTKRKKKSAKEEKSKVASQNQSTDKHTDQKYKKCDSDKITKRNEKSKKESPKVSDNKNMLVKTSKENKDINKNSIVPEHCIDISNTVSKSSVSSSKKKSFEESYSDKISKSDSPDESLTDLHDELAENNVSLKEIIESISDSDVEKLLRIMTSDDNIQIGLRKGDFCSHGDVCPDAVVIFNISENKRNILAQLYLTPLQC
ncbi:hypothetical protein GQR58_022233 [Nymphon striatum]|nr:hypothetical protein GQR58_022233 [Nymphon striatum]